MGKASGTCGGIGSSQHLHKENFYSNGIQGGIVPIATGMALAEKYMKNSKIVVVFIGDGTLGEGVVYESMNKQQILIERAQHHRIIEEHHFHSLYHHILFYLSVLHL